MKSPSVIFQTRADQVADFLRSKLAVGDWKERLPSERALAGEFGISRRSLRAALLELQREGWFDDRSRQGVKLARKKQKNRVHQASVGLVFNKHRDQVVSRLSGKTHRLLEGMLPLFQARRIRTEPHWLLYPHGNSVPRAFKQLFSDYDHDCWLLAAPTIPMQRWCRENSIPAMVLGVAEEESHLPCVGVDHFALCRHAVGEMLRMGHRKLALILPKEERGEDVLGRQGFEDGIRDAQHLDVRGHCFSHDQTTEGVCRLVDRILAMESRPTAWLVCRQGHFITLMSYLQHRGIQIPRDVSLINRDSEAYISDLVPLPTRYQASAEKRARQCARLAIKIIEGQCSPGERHFDIPEFIPGQTLGPPPA